MIPEGNPDRAQDGNHFNPAVRFSATHWTENAEGGRPWRGPRVRAALVYVCVRPTVNATWENRKTLCLWALLITLFNGIIRRIRIGFEGS